MKFSVNRNEESSKVYKYLKKRIKKILVCIGPPGLGDFILITPLLKSLKNGFPDATITFLGTIKPYIKPLVETSLYVNEQIDFDWYSSDFLVLKKIKFLLEMRKEKFDLLVDTQRKFLISLYFSFFRAQFNVGYSTKCLFSNIKFDIPAKNTHIVHQTLQLAYALGIPDISTEPEIALPKKSLEIAAEYLYKIGTVGAGFTPALMHKGTAGTIASERKEKREKGRKGTEDSAECGVPEETKYEVRSTKYEVPKTNHTSYLIPHTSKPLSNLVGIIPGAGIEQKCWFIERYVELILKIAKKGNFVFLMFGSPAENSLMEKISSSVNFTVYNVVFEEPSFIDILNMAALMSMCKVIIGNDSGLLHLASAVNTPVVGIFGPTRPEKFGPVGENVEIIFHPLDCSPCAIDFCEHRKCLRSVSVDNVLKTTENYL